MTNWLYSILALKSKLKLIRSYFFEEVSKSEVQSMNLVPKSSKDI